MLNGFEITLIKQNYKYMKTIIVMLNVFSSVGNFCKLYCFCASPVLLVKTNNCIVVSFQRTPMEADDEDLGSSSQSHCESFDLFGCLSIFVDTDNLY